MKRKMIVTTSGMCALALALAGCGGQSGDNGAASGTVPETVKYAISQDPGKLNPITNATGDGVQLSDFAYESLLSMPADKEPTGSIAKEWKATTTEATFTLKDDVTCSDGTALKASDVKATFDYVLKDAADSQYNGVYVPEGVEVSADDSAKTVTFKVPTAQSFLAEEVGQLPIVCPAGLKDPSAMDSKTFGTGPYELESASAGQKYTYKRVDSYKSGLPSGTKITDLPKSIEVSVVADQSTQTNMLGSGDLNLVKLGSSNQDRADADPQYKSTKGGSMPMSLFFNQNEKRPTGSLEVRKAVAEAIDRTKVGPTITSGKGELMKTLLPAGSSVCANTDNSAAIAKNDTEDAKKLLDEAGWKAGSDGVRTKDGKKLTVKILYNSTSGSEVAAGVELVQKELNAVGFDAQITPSDQYTNVIFSGGDWDLLISGISATTPAEWYGIFSGDVVPNGGNWTYNADKVYFSLADKAAAQAGEDSCPDWTKAEEQLLKNVTVVPLAQSFDKYYAKGFSVGTDQTGNFLPTTFKAA